MSADFVNSTYREKLLEHLFIGELLKASWKSGCLIEVSRPEVDRSGYDVILEQGSIVRHVQLKTRKLNGKASRQNVHNRLGEKASGCVVVILFDEDLRLGPFLYFGGKPSEPLPALDDFTCVKHTKRNMDGERSDRPDVLVVPHYKNFVRINSVADLVERLFGE